MHIEAELDDLHSERLLALQARLNRPIAQLAADLLAQAIDASTLTVAAESEGQKMLRILDEEGLIACIEGDGELSVNYKQHLWHER